jgi:hypothetical protein
VPVVGGNERHNTSMKVLITSTHKREREAPSLNDVTSHWLNGNPIPKIGLELIA